MMHQARLAWDRVSIYLPLMLMGCLALGSWWLVRSTPSLGAPWVDSALRHEPDYFMGNFSVRSFDASGQRKHELIGARATHYPDTDTLEITQVRIESRSTNGDTITASADRGLANSDGSEVQLFGNARVVRQRSPTGATAPLPGIEIQSEFLHFFAQTERLKTHKPVTLVRGNDRYRADGLEYDHGRQVLALQGHVRGEIMPRNAR